VDEDNVISRPVMTLALPRVLVAEDNPVNQRLTMVTLARLGLSADLVENGADAVDAAANHHYAAILMDIDMPVMDGLQATAEIRKQEASRRTRTPILALTASEVPDRAAACLAAGMDAHLAKPASLEALRDALARCGVAAGVQATLYRANS
jgi:CheY-like chemotaxis protein